MQGRIEKLCLGDKRGIADYPQQESSRIVYGEGRFRKKYRQS
jgi:hypothetical protein